MGKKVTKTFCLYPFTHIEIINDGKISPCCRFDGDYKVNGRSAHILKDEISDVMNSDHAREIREALLNGQRYDACHRCWRDEDLGLSSQRQRYNHMFKDQKNNFTRNTDYKLLSYDLKLGNTCNQMCIVCNSHNSSMIASEEKESSLFKEIFLIKDNFDWYRQDSSIEKLYKHLDTLKHIEFYGGEPWLIKQQWQLLEKLVELNLSQNITLNYATNGSIFKHEYFTEIFSNFKHVSLLYSADGIQDTFEYCRYPASWPLFESNLNNTFSYIGEKINLTIGYTVSIYSVFNIIDSLKYYRSLVNEKNNLVVWFNFVNEPIYSIKNMPLKVKKSLIEYIEKNWEEDFPVADNYAKDAFIKELKKDSNPREFKEFINYTHSKDTLRGNNILSIIPQLKEVWNLY